MNKHYTEIELFNFSEGQCSAEEMALIQEHLDHCQSCRATFENMDQAIHQFQTAVQSLDPTSIPPPPSFTLLPKSGRSYHWMGWLGGSLGLLWVLFLGIVNYPEAEALLDPSEMIERIEYELQSKSGSKSDYLNPSIYVSSYDLESGELEIQKDAIAKVAKQPSPRNKRGEQ